MHAFEYDGLGRITAYIPPAVDGSGATRTTYAYNKAQQVTRVVRPDNQEITYTYDVAGNVYSVILNDGESHACSCAILNSIIS